PGGAGLPPHPVAPAALPDRPVDAALRLRRPADRRHALAADGDQLRVPRRLRRTGIPAAAVDADQRHPPGVRLLVHRRGPRPGAQPDLRAAPAPRAVVAPLGPQGRCAMSRTLRVVTAVARELWLPVLLIAAWWWFSAGSTSLYWPPLADITDRFVDLWFFEHLVDDALPSVIRLVSGFGIGFAVAVLLGLLLGSVPALEDATRPLVEFMRALPSVALLPIMMLLLGTGDDMKVVTIAF